MGGDIAGGATLNFAVEVMSVGEAPQEDDDEDDDDEDDDNDGGTDEPEEDPDVNDDSTSKLHKNLVANLSATIRTMRPSTTKALTPENFKGFVQAAANAKKTAFVRWMEKDDDSKDCSWLLRGMTASEEVTPEGTAEDEGMHHIKMLKQAQRDPCVLVHRQAVAWNALTAKYGDDDSVVFGDVVVSDWPEVVRQSKESYVPRQPGQDLSPLDDPTYAMENDAAKKPNFDITDFAQEMADVAHNPDGHGCSFRCYNAVEIAEGQAAHPHCTDALEMVPPWISME